jgi:hypothetical protein
MSFFKSGHTKMPVSQTADFYHCKIFYSTISSILTFPAVWVGAGDYWIEIDCRHSA